MNQPRTVHVVVFPTAQTRSDVADGNMKELNANVILVMKSQHDIPNNSRSYGVIGDDDNDDDDRLLRYLLRITL